MDSHVKKLFWAFFGAESFAEKLTKERLESMQTFAQQIHLNRLEGLYVGQTADGVSIPTEAIDGEQAETLLNLAEARLGMAEGVEVRANISTEELDLQVWFLAAAEDPEKNRMIFSSGSLTKLAELGNTQAWVRWLKGEFEQADAESRAAVEEELKRGRGLVTKGKNKWKLRIRIFTQSHSVRPKAVTEWNRSTNWIKLVPVSGKKDQLIVEFILLDSIPLGGLWWVGWGLARQFVTALNIGTMGFWWWRMPEQISRFYERIDDLEKKQQVVVERSPNLKVDWGENRVLTERDLSLVSSCLAALPRPGDQDKHTPYNYYIGGVTFLSLNDVHWQCESTAFRNFFESIRAMMAQSGHWQTGTPFTSCLMEFLDKMFPEFDEREHYFGIFEAFEKQAVDTITVTLKEASFMKLFCDAYFLNEIRPKALEALAAAHAEKPISDQ